MLEHNKSHFTDSKIMGRLSGCANSWHQRLDEYLDNKISVHSRWMKNRVTLPYTYASKARKFAYERRRATRTRVLQGDCAPQSFRVHPLLIFSTLSQRLNDILWSTCDFRHLGCLDCVTTINQMLADGREMAISMSLTERNQFWKKRGICGPKPELLFGNLRELRSRSTKHETLQKWTETYGKVYGSKKILSFRIMDGGVPVLVISDLEMLNDIFIKNFHCFHARKVNYLDMNEEGRKKRNMFVVNGLRWKRLRSVSAPAFSTIRLKQISPIMNECVDSLMHKVGMKASREPTMNVLELFQHLTLDSISRCAFGFEPTPSPKKQDDFLSLCAATFADTVDSNWIFTCSKILPAFRRLWSKIYYKLFILFGEPLRRIEKIFRSIVAAREKEVKKHEQVDLDAMLHEDTFDSEELIVKKIFPEEVIAQCTLYMLAGYETTSNALSYTIYELARHPEVQEKLRSEIMDYHMNDDEKPSYESVQRMVYLDCVIRETLRLYPLASWSLIERNQFWKNRGICGPEPELLYGNLRELRSRATKHETLQKWTEKYGKVYGIMDGGVPVLVISDLEMLNDILIKNFHCFHARKVNYLDMNEEGRKKRNMFVVNGLRWKRLRSVSAPAFSTIRLKQISPIMNECVDSLMHKVGMKASREPTMNVLELFQHLTLDSISRCAFGFEPTPSQRKEDDFLSLCAATFADTVDSNWIFTCSKILPAFRRLWSKIYYKLFILFGEPLRRIEKIFRSIVAAREKEVKKHEQVDVDGMLHEDTFDSEELIVKKIFPEEVIAQCTLYMLAGYETTSNALSYTIYELARHPEVQEKLRSEIMDYHMNDDEKPSYESVQRMVYLDCVIRETLRLYPLGSWVVSRKCMQTCTTGGITIEKGVYILVDVWSIHYNKDIWGPDADEFVPERFSEDQLRSLHPLAWIPFGAGPRRCVGERFALLELKLTLTRMLRKYRIFLNDQTEVPLELQEGLSNSPRHGVVLSLKLI
ncbi:hypothetical protein M514_06421 [Trichuris suis]|uniref:Unspecific monooxygenase n=1 Tax=Trichuris suis TaxID=68888 RepID=A0A085MT21_9BILA|nr:hypothetical protein M514_06421 [Trichuris suis]